MGELAINGKELFHGADKGDNGDGAIRVPAIGQFGESKQGNIAPWLEADGAELDVIAAVGTLEQSQVLDDPNGLEATLACHSNKVG